MKMVSHIFVNIIVADMFIELIFNNSRRIEETVKRETPATVRGETLQAAPRVWQDLVEEIYHTLCEPVLNRYRL